MGLGRQTTLLRETRTKHFITSIARRRPVISRVNAMIGFDVTFGQYWLVPADSSRPPSRVSRSERRLQLSSTTSWQAVESANRATAGTARLNGPSTTRNEDHRSFWRLLVAQSQRGAYDLDGGGGGSERSMTMASLTPQTEMPAIGQVEVIPPRRTQCSFCWFSSLDLNRVLSKDDVTRMILSKKCLQDDGI